MADQATDSNIVSAGKPQKADLAAVLQQSAQQATQQESVNTTEDNVDTQAQTPNIEKPDTQSPSLTDEQVKSFLASKGIAFEDFDKLKEKINYTPPESILTEEQKAAQERAFDKRMLDYYTASGGKIEEFVALKQVASADLTELSLGELKREWKAAGFSDEEIEILKKERYYQIEDAELEQYEDEDEKDFIKRKKEYFGGKKLPTRGSYIKSQAETILADLKEAITSQDLAKQQEEQFSSKVDEHFRQMPRKLTFQLGKVNDTDIAPIEYDLSDDDVADIRETLKDPQKRQQYFFNADNTLNLSKLSDVLTRNKILENLAKTAYLTGGTKQVEEFEKTFPLRSPYQVGIGGSPNKNNGKKGQIVSSGKPQVFTPTIK